MNFDMNAIWVAVIGYFAIALKSIPLGILHKLKPYYVLSITIRSSRERLYRKLSEYLLNNINTSCLKNNLEIVESVDRGIDSERIPEQSINYGSYTVKIDTLTFMVIDKQIIESNITSEDKIRISIYGLKRLKHFNIIKEYLLSGHEEIENSIITYSGGSYGNDFSLACKKTMETIYNNEKYDIMNFIDHWLTLKHIYVKQGIVYKAGILLYGSPGTGKTTLVRGIASYLNYPIYIIDLQRYIDNPVKLNYYMERVRPNSIVLFEDIDCIVTNRDDNNDKNKALLGVILNILDGVNSPNNVLFIATTNHKEKLDPALTREGRFDLVKEICNISKDSAIEMIKAFDSDLDISNYNFPINPAYLQSEILKDKIKVKKMNE